MADLKSRLLAQDWVRAPGILSLIAVLRDEGVAARFVGGCVRDALLGRDSKDVDLAVDGKPERIVEILKVAGIRTVPTGLEHGTVTALVEGGPVEVTSLRRDVETDGRRAVVSFTRDWREDSLRRDFTVNALYADAEGEILDFHDGMADLQAGRLQFIGSAEDRIREDVLRILRFFRFQAQLNLSEFDAQGLAACRNLRGLLPQLSAERVAKELLRLLEASSPKSVLDRMIADGFLAAWAPEISDTETLQCLDEQSGACDPLLRLAALCPIPPADMERLARRLKLSGKAIHRLKRMADQRSVPADDVQARRMLYEMGASSARDLAQIRLAQTRLVRGPEAGWERLIDLAETWDVPSFPLGGKDALALGAVPGKAMGQALKVVEAAWVEGDFSEGRDALLSRLKIALEAQKA